jgi:nitrate/TMAO reductase-like tetraheme cytochrome c subunit
MVPTRDPLTAPANPEFTLRKMVNPTETCLRCHGSFDYETMALSGPWHEIRNDMEWPEAPNGCLSCHAESFRTVRHNVDYLKAENIERVAREGSSDSCYGCHGGRAWYQISYPYPRHTWPENYEDEVPEWAADRPTESDPEYALPAVE